MKTRDEEFNEAVFLLEQCLDGFGAFINGRKMARKKRDQLRARIEDFLSGQPIPEMKKKFIELPETRSSKVMDSAPQSSTPAHPAKQPQGEA